MKTYSLELGFTDDRQSDLPHPPVAEIYVKRHTSRTEDGPPIITPECVSIGELDYQIERLKAELEVIRIRARAKFLADTQKGKTVHVYSTEQR